jgi:uncharacterized membrane protein
MNALVALISALPRFLARLGVCPVVGGAAGAIAGGLTGLVQVEHAGDFSTRDILVLGLLAGAFVWLLALLVIGLWHRYGVRAIFLPALVTSLLSALLAVWVNDLVDRPGFAGLIGLVLGLLVGLLLCWLCGALVRERLVQTSRRFRE